MSSQKGFIPILVIVSILILLLIGGAYYFGVLKNILSQNVVVTQTGNTTVPSPSLTPIYIGDYEVEIKFPSDSPCSKDTFLHRCRSDIYLKDKKSGEEKYILTTDDVVNSDSRVPQYSNGYIFLVKRTGNDKYPSNDWTDELWVYVDKDKGQKIYDSKGLSYIANQDSSLIVLELYENDNPATNSVTVLSRNNAWQAKVYSVDIKQCKFDSGLSGPLSLYVVKWAEDSPALWGEYGGMQSSIGCYWKLNLATSQVTYFPTSRFQQFFALNTDKLVVLYQDKPHSFGPNGDPDWIADNKSFSLYLYNLQTGESKVIDTFPADFEVITTIGWDSPTQLHYSSPAGKKTYTLPVQ